MDFPLENPILAGQQSITHTATDAKPRNVSRHGNPHEMNQLIPKHKFDIEAAEKLNEYSIEELRPIIPALLEWLQDCNWPVSYPVRLFLEKHVAEIQNEIVDVFKTNDNLWKYWILLNLGKGINDERLIAEIKRLASNPTELEKAEELDEISKELIVDKGW